MEEPVDLTIKDFVQLCRDHYCDTVEQTVKDFVQFCKDHYWDTLTKDKDMILLHIEAIAKEVIALENKSYYIN